MSFRPRILIDPLEEATRFTVSPFFGSVCQTGGASVCALVTDLGPVRRVLPLCDAEVQATGADLCARLSAGINSSAKSSRLRTQLSLSSQSYDIITSVPKSPTSSRKVSRRSTTVSTSPAMICSPIR